MDFFDFTEPQEEEEEEEELEPVPSKILLFPSQVPYTPLDDTKNEIRLLQIFPAQSSPSDVHCQMEIFSLDDKPTYSALSYVWGDQHRIRHGIIVNDHLVAVTQNLADALSQLREDGVQRVWVDAICIDQNNQEEKGHQVQKMRTIYQMASTVLAWIGQEDEKSDRGIQVMGRIAALAQSLQLQSVLDPYSEGISLKQRNKVMNSICEPLRQDTWLMDGDIGLVISLMCRPYWERLWVIQEISLARSATILCGAAKVQWEEVQKAMASLSWLQALSTYHPSGYGTFKADLIRLYQPYRLTYWTPPPAVWVSARIWSDGKHGMQLFHLMDDTCNNTSLQASDPRDRIYALLGLVHEDDRNDTVVDYSSPHSTVFTRSTLLLLRRCGARVLMYSGLAHRDRDDGSLPSWAIEWCCTEARATGLLNNPMRDFPSIESVQTVGVDRIKLRAAVGTKVLACVPFMVFSNGVTQFLEYVQNLLHSQQFPDSNLDSTTLKRTVWRVLLYRQYPPSLSVHDIDRLFEQFLQCNSLERFMKSILPGSPDSDDQGTLDPKQNTPSPRDSPANDHTSYTFEQLLDCNEYPRNLFVTANGSIGSGPIMTAVGDAVCAFPECDVPFLLRHEQAEGHDNTWKLVGPAYVDDMVSTEGDGYFTLKDFWATNPDVEEVVLS